MVKGSTRFLEAAALCKPSDTMQAKNDGGFVIIYTFENYYAIKTAVHSEENLVLTT